MRPRSISTALALAGALAAASAWATDRAEYNRRVAERYVALFQTLDRDASGFVSRTEASGDLQFMPRFDDMDIDRDEKVTLQELARFVERETGVSVQAAPRGAAQPSGSTPR